MKLSWFIPVIAATYCSIGFGNILTSDTNYDVSLDIHRSKIASTNSTLIGASWAWEKPSGLLYGLGLRGLASPVDGFSASARAKSLSIIYGGPLVGWDFYIHRLFSIQLSVIYGFGSIKYNENTGLYDADNKQKVKTEETAVQFLDPAIFLRLGSYLDMQAVLGGGMRMLMKNTHPERVPDSALAKPFILFGIVKRMSQL